MNNEILYWYTEYEGGIWLPLRLRIAEEEMIRRLSDTKFWFNTKQYPHQPGHSNRTMVRTEERDYIFDAIKFPDGRIWESYFRKFRDEVKKGD